MMTVGKSKATAKWPRPESTPMTPPHSAMRWRKSAKPMRGQTTQASPIADCSWAAHCASLSLAWGKATVQPSATKRCAKPSQFAMGHALSARVVPWANTMQRGWLALSCGQG
jgi:hypothetical protein